MAKNHGFKVGDKVHVEGDTSVTYTIGLIDDHPRFPVDFANGDGSASFAQLSHAVDPLAVTQPALASAEDYHAKKFDKGKLRINLIPAECLEGIAGVLTYGVEKYDEDSWMGVPDAEKRYLEALFRHLLEIKKHGLRALDPESEKLHIDHVATNAAFLQYFARKP